MSPRNADRVCGGATLLAWLIAGPVGGCSRKYAHWTLRVSPLWMPIRVITSVAGPPKGGSVPSWQYTSRKAIFFVRQDHGLATY